MSVRLSYLMCFAGPKLSNIKNNNIYPEIYRKSHEINMEFSWPFRNFSLFCFQFTFTLFALTMLYMVSSFEFTKLNFVSKTLQVIDIVCFWCFHRYFTLQSFGKVKTICLSVSDIKKKHQVVYHGKTLKLQMNFFLNEFYINYILLQVALLHCIESLIIHKLYFKKHQWIRPLRKTNTRCH